ncbi:hypothetical protein FOXG_22669 [Fusarium oxysporum f. sp. lycopersici 4287]|uniref:Uncharacterized protein n=1 Tax=Fusarium oxysporum f. sp. lycopersici (strain 4287 / CBS 123668 / FGSC 9935 / NRRL 34936) TaxID=426428 RepID=A0A0J9VTI5_FUSO4|nr:hypothetical protein FOXG_20997 [Fusarium oxysporum f. sp. lycopersici 4287]XP_018252121.1 hypothetical protein FOXG_21040 [Fusarium oxysporum f. sp. lycopersici 4287]XP_018253473.1 hypothetical protein FOXG_21318 [Fusarium oxysporum f. sp. lycopersici 4287]XP_018257937.1 hypothetical protein FOXG_22669 [Fusarium oxysporum f. sp. lycopersici 4287]KNB13959.1 hypothetical protein FOXG_20997 [Fusarium oxysporum f. sp. lycopersici 4287]KNB14076.1 hypothetical protein FOXG_21040 [Fusarium oxyspo
MFNNQASLDPSLQAQSTAGSNAAAALKPFTDSSTSLHYWHRLRDSNLRPCNRFCYASSTPEPLLTAAAQATYVSISMLAFKKIPILDPNFSR